MCVLLCLRKKKMETNKQGRWERGRHREDRQRGREGEGGMEVMEREEGEEQKGEREKE